MTITELLLTFGSQIRFNPMLKSKRQRTISEWVLCLTPTKWLRQKMPGQTSLSMTGTSLLNEGHRMTQQLSEKKKKLYLNDKRSWRNRTFLTYITIMAPLFSSISLNKSQAMAMADRIWFYTTHLKFIKSKQ